LNVSVQEWIIEEASRCFYCGFCEALCPTLPLGVHRGYGPRGRVRIALYIARHGFTLEAVKAVYSCLLCAACTLKCPANIDIPALVRAARTLYIQRSK